MVRKMNNLINDLTYSPSGLVNATRSKIVENSKKGLIKKAIGNRNPIRRDKDIRRLREIGNLERTKNGTCKMDMSKRPH